MNCVGALDFKKDDLRTPFNFAFLEYLPQLISLKVNEGFLSSCDLDLLIPRIENVKLFDILVLESYFNVELFLKLLFNSNIFVGFNGIY